MESLPHLFLETIHDFPSPERFEQLEEIQRSMLQREILDLAQSAEILEIVVEGPAKALS